MFYMYIKLFVFTAFIFVIARSQDEIVYKRAKKKVNKIMYKFFVVK